MSIFTVSEVARLSGVSVRTLHHYDELGLLKPACVGENGYRYYGQAELLRLQQILFHRELDLPLETIRQALDDPGFDRIAALKAHRVQLLAQARRCRDLVKTLDATLAALEGDADMTEQAMFKGFDPEKQAEHEAWLMARYGDGMRARLDEAKAGMRGWRQADFDRVQAEFGEIEDEVAAAMAQGLPANSEAVRRVVRRLHAWVGRAWSRSPTAEAFCGLADLYRDNPGFRDRYEARAAGLTDYLAEAMRSFAAAELA